MSLLSKAPSRATLLLLAALFVFFSARRARAEELKFANLGDFQLESRETIKDCRIGYRTFGRLNDDHSNAILFPTWFTGKSKDLVQYVGSEKMLDPGQYFVVLIDALANGVSSSPSNTTAQAKDTFPRVTIRDMVNAEYLLATKELGLKHVRAVIGISMGGMQAFQWAVSYPAFMDRVIPIVGTPQQSSYDLLLWSTEERTIREHLKKGDETAALDEATLIDLLNLTTPANVVDHTKREDFDKFVADSIKETKENSDPYDYLWQLGAMIRHDISPSGGTLEDAAKLVRAKMLVVNGRQDHMVNPIPALHFAELVKAPTLVLESDCGHLSTDCQGAVMAAAVRGFLSQK